MVETLAWESQREESGTPHEPRWRRREEFYLTVWTCWDRIRKWDKRDSYFLSFSRVESVVRASRYVCVCSVITGNGIEMKCQKEKCDSSVLTGIFTVTDCLKAAGSRGGAVECTQPSPSHQLHPHSHHRPLHSIPIRPGLISISVVTAARGLGGWLGRTPRLWELSLIFLPAQTGPGPSFSLISVVILGCTASPDCTAVHTGCTTHHYRPITDHSANSYHSASSHTALLSLFNLPLKHPGVSYQSDCLSNPSKYEL